MGLDSCSCSTRRATTCGIDADLGRQLLLLLGIVRHELVQGRVDQADRHREAVHGLEDADEIARWNGRSLARALRRASEVSAMIIS